MKDFLNNLSEDWKGVILLIAIFATSILTFSLIHFLGTALQLSILADNTQAVTLYLRDN